METSSKENTEAAAYQDRVKVLAASIQAMDYFNAIMTADEATTQVAELLLGRVNAPEQEIYRVAREIVELLKDAPP